MVAGNGPQDYPDWIRLQQQAAPLSFFISQTATLTPTQGNWIYVGNVTHLIINMSTGPFAVLAKAVFLFADDNVGTNATHKTSAWCDLTHPTRAIIPVMGNWMRITTSSSAGDGVGQGLAMYGEGVSYVPRPGLISDPSDAIHATSAAVAPGGVITTDLARTTPGPWRLFISSTQTGINVNVEQEFTTGVWLVVLRLEVAGSGIAGGDAVLVAAPTRIRVQNNNAAAADMTFIFQPPA